MQSFFCAFKMFILTDFHLPIAPSSSSSLKSFHFCYDKCFKGFFVSAEKL